jgi:hypothetical protein
MVSRVHGNVDVLILRDLTRLMDRLRRIVGKNYTRYLELYYLNEENIKTSLQQDIRDSILFIY